MPLDPAFPSNPSYTRIKQVLGLLHLLSLVSLCPASQMATLGSFGGFFHRVKGTSRFSTTFGQGNYVSVLAKDMATAFRGGALPDITKRTFGSTFVSQTMKHRVFLAVGSNLGNRFQNIATALSMLCDPTFEESSYVPSHLIRTSFLHNTAPMYVTDQPAFLNGAVEIHTDMPPHSLLHRLKKVESHLGRNFSAVRNGPRPVDLDILFYDDIAEDGSRISPRKVESPDLIVPHLRIQEREFVLAPLNEVAGNNYDHPQLNCTIGDLFDNLRANGGANSAVRMLPLPRERMILFNETIIMGILNVTPDSFSDGGKWNSSIDIAVGHAIEMERNGAGIIDIGGESTRPGAKEISVEEQIQRTAPVIKRIREVSDVPISIDTRHAAVAKAAIEAGADIVNDVSGGTFDPDMLATVAELGVPIILMHMRGTPSSMQGMTVYDDVVEDVVQALLERSRNAEKAGVPRWLQVVDPGIGFAKDIQGNLLLLKEMASIRSKLGDLPILLGTSRKGFIGKLTGEMNVEERDYGTIGSCVAALCLGNGPAGCSILRVHNVKAAKQAAVVMDAIRNAS
jgi:dihydropteroate synthase/2-amino-4-hydroxy-6-hydroxymethyldihydropteridine diphosphokinase